MAKYWTGIDSKRLDPPEIYLCDDCKDTGKERYLDKKYGPSVRSCKCSKDSWDCVPKWH